MEHLTEVAIAELLAKIRKAEFAGDRKLMERLKHLAFVGFAYHCSQFAEPTVQRLAKKILEAEAIGRAQL